MRMRVRDGRFRLWGWVLCLCMFLLQGEAFAEIPFGKGLLFRIEKGNAAPSYLFGTIHLEDKRVVTLPEPVRTAFDQSRQVVLEMTMEGTSVLKVAAGMVYADGRELRQVLGDDLYGRTVAAAESRGLPEVALRHYKPWSVVTLLIVPPPKTGQFLDFVLFQTAKNTGKQVVGLESAEEQLAVFDGMREGDQIMMLEDTLNNLEQLPTMFESMLDAYLKRDLAALVAINETYQESGDQQLAKVFQERFVDDRNLRMVERLHPMLSEGGVFVAVGALHLPGEKGILNLLKRAGYHVEVVY